MQFAFAAPPTFVLICVVSDDKQFVLAPTTDNGLFPLAYSVCSIQLIEALLGYSISITAFRI